MRARVSEKKLLAALICLAAGLFFFFNITVIKSPVRFFEKDIVLALLALCLVAFSLMLLKRAVQRM